MSASISQDLDIIMHGGKDSKGNNLSGTWKIRVDTDNNTAESTQLTDSQHKISGHTVNTIGPLCIILGGRGCKHSIAYNGSDCHIAKDLPVKFYGHSSWSHKQEL